MADEGTEQKRAGFDTIQPMSNIYNDTNEAFSPSDNITQLIPDYYDMDPEVAIKSTKPQQEALADYSANTASSTATFTIPPFIPPTAMPCPKSLPTAQPAQAHTPMPINASTVPPYTLLPSPAALPLTIVPSGPPTPLHGSNLGNSLLGNPVINNMNMKSALEMQERMKNRFMRNEATSEAEVLPDHSIDYRADSPLTSSGEADLDAEEEAEFQRLEARYERMRQAGTQSIEEEIEWMKRKASHEARLRKRRADALANREPSPNEEWSLFIPEEPEIPSYSSMVSDDDNSTRKRRRGRKRKAASDFDDDSPANKTSKPRRVVKKTTGNTPKGRKVSNQNYTDGDVSTIIRRAAEESKTNVATKPKPKPKSKPKPKPEVKDAKKAPAKAKAGRGKRAQPTISNIPSVFGTDVFADAEEVAHLRSQPKFSHSTRRDQQLKDLVASLPEADKETGHADKRALDQAIKSFNGVGTVKGVGGDGWLVKGMKTPLKTYQVLGVGFMRRRENGSELPLGGLNADQMGLGKTISMLANIVNGKLVEDSTKARPTLIVAAPALIKQWRSEIAKHVQSERENKKYGLGMVIEHRAGSRVVSDDPVAVLSSAHVILTTYQECARSFPKAIFPPHLATAQQKDEWWAAHLEKNKGVLHRIKYNRVVLDEAQAIKNPKGHISYSVRGLDATYRWAITGTPILNSIKEFYPYFKFLKVPYTGSFRIFKENFCSPDDPDGIKKLSVFLTKFMVRRTHSDRLFNSRLLDLPVPRSHTVWVEFNEVERSVYEIVKNRMINRINQMSKSEEVLKNYSNIWTMILRLRQLCGHVLTVQETLGDVMEREDFEKLNAITIAEDRLNEQSGLTLLHLRQVLAKNDEKMISAGEGDGPIVTTSETVPSGVLDIDKADEQALGGRHGLTYRFQKYLDDLRVSNQYQEMNKRKRCAACNSLPLNPKVTSCFHIYCELCLRDLSHYAARRGHDGMACKKCGEIFHHTQDIEDEMSRTGTPSESSPAEDLPGRAGARKKKNDGDMKPWITMRGEIVPSAKTTACKAQIMNWLEEYPTEKIIVFTQFLAIVDIMAKVCHTEEWKFVRYHGNMSHDSRQKAIYDFADEGKGVQIMLASLKCGGLGLNLTMASRVICFDPWWNEAVEQQAFCRVYRIGQTQETRLTRFLVKNTIDAAMQAMKERKQIEIDEVMESAKEKLDVKDLMRLFGRVEEDEGGRPFIFADDDDDVKLHRDDDSGDELGHMGNDI